ncbi:hypothetical protein HDK64DRAFT_313995 [Phyllosticta capitalensis]
MSSAATARSWATSPATAQRRTSPLKSHDAPAQGAHAFERLKAIGIENMLHQSILPRQPPDPALPKRKARHSDEDDGQVLQLRRSWADCTNPRVFRGECRHCKQEGHPAAECPDKPATLCRNCEQEGHTVFLAGNICTKDKGKILVHEVGH